MKVFHYIFAGLMMCSLTAWGQSSRRLSPTPQKVYFAQGNFVEIPTDISLLYDKDINSSYATEAYRSLLADRVKPNGKYKVTIGVRGNKSVRSHNKQIPARAEGYFLKIDKDKIIAAANDERGLFYAAQTLRQLVEGGNLPIGEITDYPDVKHRGVVEGFYGTPWSSTDRERQLDFYGRNKLNVYIYGPKDDKYHSVPNWREPYPADEAEQIRALVKRAHDNGVMFYWAIHPGQDIKWTNEDRDNVVRKFELMYALGVRAFAVFFDDISGEGTKAEKQAELLNYIDDNFVRVKGDVAPLMMCPTEYNKSWANVKGGYLTTLGDKLNNEIEIMWTGNRVVASIDKPTMEWINPLIKRKAYIWWNFPVSDYVRDHLLLGATYGNSLDIKDELSGFVSNPMERAEASKIALYSVADYTWNMAAYDSSASWHAAIKDLMPNCAAEMQTFAYHNSDLGPNGHRYRRAESENIEAELKKLSDSRGKDISSMMAVMNECERLERAAYVLSVSKDNPNLITEIKPWLTQAGLVGNYGKQVISMLPALEAGNSIDFEASYQYARALQQLMYKVDTEENQNPYQPGVKVGSRILLPTLNSLFSYAVAAYNSRTGAALDTSAVYTPFTLSSDVAQLSSLPIFHKGLTANVASSNEVVRWGKNESLTIRCIEPMSIKDLMINLGTESVAEKFRLEILTDSGDWITIPISQAKGNANIVATQSQDNVTAIRLTQITDSTIEVFFKSFKFGYSPTSSYK